MTNIIDTRLALQAPFVVREEMIDCGATYVIHVEGRCVQTGEPLCFALTRKIEEGESLDQCRKDGLDGLSDWVANRMTRPDGQGRTIRPLTTAEIRAVLLGPPDA